MSELEQVAFASKMHEFIEEVAPYLHSEQRLDVREQGLEILLSQMQILIGINDEDLITMIDAVALCLDQSSMHVSALTLLVNISAECGHIFQRYDMKVMYKHCYKAIKENHKSVDLILMFLTNVTTIEEKARELLWIQDEEDIKKIKNNIEQEKDMSKGNTLPPLTSSLSSSLSSSSSSSSTSLDIPPLSSFATHIIINCLKYNPQIEPDQLHGSLVAWDEIDPWQYSNNIMCNIR